MKISNEKLTSPVSTKLTKSVLKQVDELARKQDRPRSSIIRMAVLRYVERKDR